MIGTRAFERAESKREYRYGRRERREKGAALGRTPPNVSEKMRPPENPASHRDKGLRGERERPLQLPYGVLDCLASAFATKIPPAEDVDSIILPSALIIRPGNPPTGDRDPRALSEWSCGCSNSSCRVVCLCSGSGGGGRTEPPLSRDSVCVNVRMTHKALARTTTTTRAGGLRQRRLRTEMTNWVVWASPSLHPSSLPRDERSSLLSLGAKRCRS